jgi:hypothetical protein
MLSSKNVVPNNNSCWVAEPGGHLLACFHLSGSPHKQFFVLFYEGRLFF